MTVAVRTRYLLDLLSQVPDPRKRRGRRHQLAGLPAVGVASVIAGSRSFAAIGQWAAVRDLLAAFADLTGAVITLDALHTQRGAAQLILGRLADYAMTVKGNTPTLFGQLKALPWPKVPLVSTVTKGPRPTCPPHRQGRPGTRLDRVRRGRPRCRVVVSVLPGSATFWLPPK